MPSPVDLDEDRLIAAFYRSATDAEGLHQALDLLAAAFRCRSAGLLSFSPAGSPTDFSVVTGLFDGPALDRYREYQDIDPAPAAFARLAAGTASTTDRLFPVEVIREGVFVNEFYRPIGLAETMAGLLRYDGKRFEMLALHRGDDRAEFGEDEIATIERLLPHVERALQLRRVFQGQARRIAGFEAAMDRLSSAIVVLDETGAAIFTNASAQAIGRRGDGLTFDRAGRPIAAEAIARRRIETLVADVLSGGAGGVVAVRRPRAGSRPYAVLVAPAPVVEGAGRGANGGAVIVIQDPESALMSSVEIVQEALGLPNGAARLVVALAGEDDLRSYAERAGITIHTARFHLATALERTGTHTQMELVRLAVRVMRDFDLRAAGKAS
jgi:hypothetical protein